MKYEEIKRLMDDVGESKLTSIDIEFPDGTKIKINKDNKKEEIIQKEKEEEKVQTVISNEQKEDTKEEKIVKSPMVGTFYSKSSPTAKKYVEVGDKVKKGDVLCIVEAMKLMNEIESEFDGKIKKICVKDGDIVEYGKQLFIIE